MTIFNPHDLSPEGLKARFVVRKALLHELESDLRRGGAQHHLLIGDHGSGKTMLLLRLAYLIDDDPQLAKRAIALRFPEEQYNVTTLADLWTNAVDALVDAHKRRGESERAAKLETDLAALRSLDADARAREALALLVQTKKPRRSVVLLLDNLDLILDRLRDQQWALREVLSADNGLVVIGASSKMLADTTTYEAAFYDFFKLHQLAPLTEDEAQALVRTLDPELDLSNFKVLYTLAGGSPRLLATGRDLGKALDLITPYYKARIDALPPQSQVIVDAVAQQWHPTTAAACAEYTRLDINVVSAQLSRLVKAGLVAKVSLPDGSKLGFQIAERFFNTWYLMRAGRQQADRFMRFTYFLKEFYSAPFYSAPLDANAVRALTAKYDLESLFVEGQPLAPEARAVADDVSAILKRG
jgi:hypothetical protein